MGIAEVRDSVAVDNGHSQRTRKDRDKLVFELL